MRLYWNGLSEDRHQLVRERHVGQERPIQYVREGECTQGWRRDPLLRRLKVFYAIIGAIVGGVVILSVAAECLLPDVMFTQRHACGTRNLALQLDQDGNAIYADTKLNLLVLFLRGDYVCSSPKDDRGWFSTTLQMGTAQETLVKRQRDRLIVVGPTGKQFIMGLRPGVAEQVWSAAWVLKRPGGTWPSDVVAIAESRIAAGQRASLQQFVKDQEWKDGE